MIVTVKPLQGKECSVQVSESANAAIATLANANANATTRRKQKNTKQSCHICSEMVLHELFRGMQFM